MTLQVFKIYTKETFFLLSFFSSVLNDQGTTPINVGPHRGDSFLPDSTLLEEHPPTTSAQETSTSRGPNPRVTSRKTYAYQPQATHHRSDIPLHRPSKAPALSLFFYPEYPGGPRQTRAVLSSGSDTPSRSSPAETLLDNLSPEDFLLHLPASMSASVVTSITATTLSLNSSRLSHLSLQPHFSLHPPKQAVHPGDARQHPLQPIELLPWPAPEVLFSEPPVFRRTRETGREDYDPERLLQAYDCSFPLQIQDLSSAHVFPCQLPSAPILSEVKQYLLLQKEKRREIAAYQCQLLLTRTVDYCGVYDHQTRYPEKEFYLSPQVVDAATCLTWHLKRTFSHPDTQVSQELKWGENEIHYYRHGPEGAGHAYTTPQGELKCIGTPFYWGKRDDWLSHAVVHEKAFITLSNETLIVGKDQQVLAFQDQLRLPCRAPEQACMVEQGTYVWTYTTEWCPLALLRTVTGSEVSNPDKDKVFMSSDGSLTRLIHQGLVQHCSTPMISTNYPDIFLLDEALHSEHQFHRKIRPAEIDLSKYINNRDDFLYSQLSQALSKEFEHLLVSHCQDQGRPRPLFFLNHHAQPDLSTWSLGNGSFATSTGDVVYQYQCQPILVQALDRPLLVVSSTATSEDHCYNGLPISIVQGVSGGYQNTVNLFLEPISHRVTLHAHPVPCSLYFGAKYQNRDRHWIQATPSISPATTPSKLTWGGPFQSSLDLDFSKGGLYQQDDLDHVQESQEYRRAEEARIRTITQTIHLNPQLPGLPPPDWLKLFPVHPLKTFTDWLNKTIEDFGRRASIFVALFLLGRLTYLLLQRFYGFLIWSSPANSPLSRATSFLNTITLTPPYGGPVPLPGFTPAAPDFVSLQQYRALEQLLRNQADTRLQQSTETDPTSPPIRVPRPEKRRRPRHDPPPSPGPLESLFRPIPVPCAEPASTIPASVPTVIDKPLKLSPEVRRRYVPLGESLSPEPSPPS